MPHPHTGFVLNSLGQLSDIVTHVQDLCTTLDAYADACADKDRRFQALRQEHAALQQQLESVQQQLGEARATITTMEGHPDVVKARGAQKAQALAAAQARLQAAQAEVEQLSS